MYYTMYMILVYVIYIIYYIFVLYNTLLIIININLTLGCIYDAGQKSCNNKE